MALFAFRYTMRQHLYKINKERSLTKPVDQPGDELQLVLYFLFHVFKNIKQA